MNTDFRLSIGYFEHPKVMKLSRRLGDSGVLSHIKLLRFTAMNKPDGDLAGMDVEDIEIASGFSGECGEFVAALIALRLLDEGEGGYAIHDWAQHNPYAAHANARSEKAQKAASIRWAGKQDATGAHPQCSEHDLALLNAPPSNAPSPAPIPAPSPSPSPKEEDANANALSAAAPPAKVKKVSSERSEQIGQEAVREYQDRYKRVYGTYAEFLQGDAPALKDALIKLGAKYAEALDRFFGCPNERVKVRRHAVKLFCGEINVWLDDGAVSVSFPPPMAGARASPRNGQGMTVEERKERTRGWIS